MAYRHGETFITLLAVGTETKAIDVIESMRRTTNEISQMKSLMIFGVRGIVPFEGVGVTNFLISREYGPLLLRDHMGKCF